MHDMILLLYVGILLYNSSRREVGCSDVPFQEFSNNSNPLSITNAGPRARVHLHEGSAVHEGAATGTPTISIAPMVSGFLRLDFGFWISVRGFHCSILYFEVGERGGIIPNHAAFLSPWSKAQLVQRYH